MYYPVGWHKVLKLDVHSTGESMPNQPGNIITILANSERELYLILTTQSLHLWCPRPPVEIASHRRSASSIEAIGSNKAAVWKTDSSVIVVATQKDQLLFFQVRQRILNSSSSNFLLSSPSSGNGIYRIYTDTKNLENMLSKELAKEVLSDKGTESDQIPGLTLYTFGKLDLSSVGVSCLMAAEEELILGAKDGSFYGVHWNGNIDETFPWSLEKDDENPKFIVDLKFSSVLSGFSMVFSDGRVAFMPLKLTFESDENSTESQKGNNVKNRSQVNYLSSVNNAVCTEVNHKHRLVAFGVKSSKVIVCNIEEPHSSLIVNHKLELTTSRFPNLGVDFGSITSMRYSPDSFVLATAWEAGGFAIWSVFGSLLFCSLQWDMETTKSMLRVSSLAWGREGHTLWMSTIENTPDKETNENIVGSNLPDDCNIPVEENENSHQTHDDGEQTNCELGCLVEDILIVPIAHSTLPSSPHLTCSSDSIILLSEDRLYIGPSVPHKAEFDHWFVIDIPRTYLNNNYPIRYATVDRNCNNVVIAGSQGFALYSIASSKWKYFAKNSHEHSFTVCGDIIWWNEYLVLSCYNMEKETCEIRAYLSHQPLDNNNAVIQTIPMEIIRMSLFENRLLVLYSDGTFGMFMLNLRRKQQTRSLIERSLMRSNSTASKLSIGTDDSSVVSAPMSENTFAGLGYPLRKQSVPNLSLQISPIENLVISNLPANPYCISSIALTRLHFKNDRLDDSILLNSCGKLFLLERELPPSLSSDVAFKVVSVIATNVEQFWISPEISSASDMSYFRKSLWLSCGGAKNQLKVWLPLLNDKNDAPTDLYVPDRIMLPIRCDIYPLAIRSSTPNEIGPDDAIVLGAECDILYRDNELFSLFPFSTVKRQCRVYLHRILRELLLNQHLGYYARKIAESCQSLPYFAHCFELLLHEVLEEEATSPVPLPDPMLPQVVGFIKKFPVYLETVVHCARKSELSMWSYLFDERAVGNPIRLFKECLEKKKLDTASSCLIILQSLDKNIVSKRMIRDLIKAAQDDMKYSHLVEDMESFLLRAEIDCLNLSGNGSPI